MYSSQRQRQLVESTSDDISNKYTSFLERLTRSVLHTKPKDVTDHILGVCRGKEDPIEAAPRELESAKDLTAYLESVRAGEVFKEVMEALVKARPTTHEEMCKTVVERLE
jgi:hypothetical protein